MVIDEKRSEDRMKRLIVIENLAQSTDETDMQRAMALCAKVHPNLTVEDVFRERPVPLPPTAGPNGNEAPKRPPILKVLLWSEGKK